MRWCRDARTRTSKPGAPSRRSGTVRSRLSYAPPRRWGPASAGPPLVRRRGRQSLERQLLQSHRRAGDVDVALRVGRDVMAAADLSRQLDAADNLHRLAVDDDDVVAVADVEELLVGIGGERQVARKLRVGLHDLLQELAVGRERLHAAV